MTDDEREKRQQAQEQYCIWLGTPVTLGEPCEVYIAGALAWWMILALARRKEPLKHIGTCYYVRPFNQYLSWAKFEVGPFYLANLHLTNRRP